jgi:hypothetical protein
VAECARLESVYRETYRGFKSRILRHPFSSTGAAAYLQRRLPSPRTAPSLTSSGAFPHLERRLRSPRAAPSLTSSGAFAHQIARLNLDADVLALQELVNASESAFSSKPALFEPTKWRGRI